MPRPNSRVEIVTAMRRIRVSVARVLLPFHLGVPGVLLHLHVQLCLA